MGSDLSTIQNRNQNRFNNHVVYNPNNNNQVVNQNQNQQSLDLKHQTTVLKNEFMIIQDSVKLIDRQNHCGVGLDVHTLVEIDIEFYFFIEEEVEDFHMNTRSFKFLNKKHHNKYIAQIKRNTEQQYVEFKQIEIDKNDIKQQKQKQNNYFMIIRLIKEHPEFPQIISYFYTVNQELKVQLMKSKMIHQNKEFLIQQIYGVNDCSFNISQLQNKDSDLCTVCMTDKIDIIIMPCRHMCICMNCVNDFQKVQNVNSKKCPLCRKDIISFIRLSC